MQTMRRGNSGPVIGMAMVALALVLTGIIISAGLQVNEDFTADLTVDSAAYNASLEAQEGAENLANKQGMAGTIAGISAIIALLFGGFGFLLKK